MGRPLAPRFLLGFPGVRVGGPNVLRAGEAASGQPTDLADGFATNPGFRWSPAKQPSCPAAELP